jgi:ABC-type transporter Mla maintaining outer membrane lipid asymmetry ATPase subunit MlaF
MSSTASTSMSCPDLVVVIGGSGSGKSVLLKCILSLINLATAA